MAGRSDSIGRTKRRSLVARVLAPLALLACAVAVFLLVSGLDSDEEPEGQREKTRKEQIQAQRQKGPETYVVQQGDTLTEIAQRTGVGVAKLERLNPQLDTATLNAGQTLKLR